MRLALPAGRNVYLTKSIKNKKDEEDEEEERGRDKLPTRITLARQSVKFWCGVLKLN